MLLIHSLLLRTCVNHAPDCLTVNYPCEMMTKLSKTKDTVNVYQFLFRRPCLSPPSTPFDSLLLPPMEQDLGLFRELEFHQQPEVHSHAVECVELRADRSRSQPTAWRLSLDGDGSLHNHIRG